VEIRAFQFGIYGTLYLVWQLIFTALHVMQTRYSEENSVRLSVRLSVTRVIPEKNGRKIGPDFYTIRKNIYPSFLRRRMVGGGATPSI